MKIEDPVAYHLANLEHASKSALEIKEKMELLQVELDHHLNMIEIAREGLSKALEAREA